MSKGPGYTEFKLKLNASAVDNLQHHVLILNSTSLELSDLTSPIRLSRQKMSGMAMDDEGDGDENQREAKDDADTAEDQVEPSSRRASRRRTRIISLERKKRLEEEEEQEKEECTPWVLEDADAQHTFIGRLEGGQQSNYVFFVNRGREFLAVPTAEWFHFNPKPAYRPLTTEEAEAQMAARGKNRLVLAQQLQRSRQISPTQSTDSLEAQKNQPKLKALRETMMNEAQVAASHGQYGRPVLASATTSALQLSTLQLHQEEMDFDEVFDDDDMGEEVADGMDEDDPSAPKPVLPLARPTQKLSAAGRDLGKLVRSLDRKIVDYRHSDEERDPYADPDDIASEEDDGHLSDASSGKSSRATTPNPPGSRLPPHLGGEGKNVLMRPASLPSLSPPPPQSSRTSVSTVNSPDKRSAGKGNKRSAADIAEDAIDEDKSVKPLNIQPKISETQLIVKEDIIGLLKKGPLRTKDLIHTLRDRLKTDAAKESFKEIIKKVATVRTGTNEDEKWLELKQEFI
jgi:hypothetical protein